VGTRGIRARPGASIALSNQEVQGSGQVNVGIGGA
jgi:hypothetical protein